MAKKVVSLYIDDISIRLLVTRGNEVSKWLYAPLESGLVEGAVIIKEDEVAGKIKEALDTQEIKTKKVNVGISGLLCLTRAITFPQLPKAMLAEAVVREAKKVMPMAMENLYNVSWQSISSPKNEMRAFMIAVRQKTIDALVRTLKKAGLEIRFLDLKPLALLRAVTEKTAVILDVQPNEFDIVVMAEGIPQPIRTIPFPQNIQSLQEKLQMVVEHTDNTVKFYNSHNADKPLPPETPIFLSGELASELQLRQSLSDKLGQPVHVLPSPLKYPDSFNLSQFMVNIGLALRELPLGDKTGLSVAKLNTLPIAYQPKHFSLARVSVVPGMAVFAIAVIPLMMLTQSTSTNLEAMQNQIEMTNQLIEQKQMEKQGLSENIAELEQRLADAETSRNTFTEVSQSFGELNDTVNGDVAAANSLLPDTVSLSMVNHDGKIMKIDGQAPGENEVLLYASSLRDSNRFIEVTVAKMTRTDDDRMDFTLMLKS